MFPDSWQDTRDFNFLIIKLSVPAAHAQFQLKDVIQSSCEKDVGQEIHWADNLTSKYFCSWICPGIEGACMSSPTSELLTFSENLKHWRLGCQHTVEPSKHILQQDADQHQAAPTWAAWKRAVPSWFSLALIQLGEIKNCPEVVAQNPKVYFPRKNKYFLMCTINPSWVKSCQCKNWGSKFPGFTLLATEYLFVLNTIVFLLVNLRPGICHVWMS